MSAHTLHPEALQATVLDAAGNHDEAINCLARGAGAGDAGCLFELGLRLATGDRAPLLALQGLDLLADALARGAGEAGARGAALLALGTNLPGPDWNTAREWLTRAAAQGHEPSRRQLLALCDDRPLVARVAAGASGKVVDWRTVAAAIDLAAWHNAPPLDVKSADPRVCAVPNLARPEICDFIVSLAPGRLGPAKVYDPVAREDIVVAHRNNTQAQFSMLNVEFAQVLLQSRMSAACSIPVRHFEGPAVLHYSPGERITNHFDFVDPESTADYAGEIERNGQRVVTFLLYLNEDYEGGETDFPTLGIRNKGRKGDGIFFVNSLPDNSPDLRMLHAGMPPTRGEKWLVTQFVRSRSTR
jgi:prolyl 4-hydroxylase